MRFVIYLLRRRIPNIRYLIKNNMICSMHYLPMVHGLLSLNNHSPVLLVISGFFISSGILMALQLDHLVAKGFHQRPGVDYIEIYSPGIKPHIIKLVLCIALSNNWSLCRMDVNNAFLHGSISEDIYISQPPNFVNSHFQIMSLSFTKSCMVSNKHLILCIILLTDENNM